MNKLYQVNRHEFDVLEYVVNSVVSEINATPDSYYRIRVFVTNDNDVQYLQSRFESLIHENEKVYDPNESIVAMCLFGANFHYECTPGHSRINVYSAESYSIDILQRSGIHIGIKSGFRVIYDDRDWQRIIWDAKGLDPDNILSFLSVVQAENCIWHKHLPFFLSYLMTQYPRILEQEHLCNGRVHIVDIDKFLRDDYSLLRLLYVPEKDNIVGYMDKSKNYASPYAINLLKDFNFSLGEIENEKVQ